MRNETARQYFDQSQFNPTLVAVKTPYYQKVLCLEIRRLADHNLIQCGLQAETDETLYAQLEKSNNGFQFEKISSFPLSSNNTYPIIDYKKTKEQTASYRLLVRDKKGVTYYSEIISS